MPVSISVSTVIIELVIFLATVWMMQAWVFVPIHNAWTERNRRIQEGLEAASISREEAERARAEVERILRESRIAAQRQLDQATTQGDKIREQLVAEATAEFRRLVADARQGIVAERERSAAELRSRIVDLALLAASRVTGQEFREPQVRELAAVIVEREGLA